MATTAPATTFERRVFSPVEAGQLLGLSVRTLRTLTALGKLPAIRLSARRIGYAREDLDRFIAANRK
jgi:excisionase family DNA binding protein